MVSAEPGLAVAACDGPHGVNSLLVGRERYMAVVGIQVAHGLLGDIQAFGDRAQVGEVVQAEVAHEAPRL